MDLCYCVKLSKDSGDLNSAQYGFAEVLLWDFTSP